ncbi:uncharacterized protein LOC144620520 [Crassostrea virginica]
MVFSDDEVNKVIEVWVTVCDMIPALKFSLQVQIEKKSNKGLLVSLNETKKTARKHLKKGHIQNKELVIPPGHFLSVRNCQNTLVSATLEDEMGQSYTENSSSILLQRSPLC